MMAMCSPKVMRSVQERIEREGLPSLSRRNFLQLGAVSALGALATSILRANGVARASSNVEVIDLSHVFGTNIPTYLPDEKPKREDYVTVEKDGFYIQRWTYTEHAGTHVDIPAHFIAKATTADVYPAQQLVGQAVVIDITEKAAREADSTLDMGDVMAWERANGKIPEGAIVFMYSGWDSRWSDLLAFRNADANDVQHYPGVSAEAAVFLIEERKVKGIGVDTLSLDFGASTTFDAHYAILGRECFGIENVANLAQIKGREAMVVVGMPRWEEGSGGPARVLALV
ncbi:MAG: cyclase family protein [Chloroflexota bacterium]|uniref:Cyclase n=1 Tax=Candidatus Thermofonsia Clade 1 bacterium TaxID=2364210 RepID=A0A2M8PZG9_9CHLR|nr:MAG: cyclase [Candidatus Thermofonsia Clade 1 bacterium]RMF53409.1 MAG: cyclase family protein [Chloroflexota bacterium]